MDSDDLYDEFGNFVGDANDSDAESGAGTPDPAPGHFAENHAQNHAQNRAQNHAQNHAQNLTQNRPPEHSQNHTPEQAPWEDPPAGTPKAVFVPEAAPAPAVETIVVNAASAGPAEPVIRPAPQAPAIEHGPRGDAALPATTYLKAYMRRVAQQQPERVRNVAVVGHLHSGKTSLVDSLVTHTHPGVGGGGGQRHGARPVRFLDTHPLERERGVSLHTSAVSLLLQDSRDRSFAVCLLDCPGHADFRDERLALMGAVEGVVVVVDVVEGLGAPTKTMVSEAMRRNLPMTVVLSKLDRLVLELQLAPRDAGRKISHVLAAINGHVHHNEHAAAYTHERLFSPLNDNVVFASHALGASFTLASWSRLYAARFHMDAARLRFLLWGDVYLHEGRFRTAAPAPAAPTLFELLVLEPMYKLVAHTLVADAGDGSLARLLWDHFAVALPRAAYREEPQTLLRTVFRAVFPDTRDLVHLIVHHTPPPRGAAVLASRGVAAASLGPDLVVADVFKTSLRRDAPAFECLAKVVHGTLRAGDAVHVVAGDGDGGGDGAVRSALVRSIHVPVARYHMDVDAAPEGTIVVLRGVAGAVGKAATLYARHTPPPLLRPIHRADNGLRSFYKVAVECENPAELPRLVAALQRLAACYLSAEPRLEESGEHVLLAPGELYLDCFLHDLRHASTPCLAIRVSDPMVRFAETCGERSAARVAPHSPSETCLLAVSAEPVRDARLLAAIEKGAVSLAQPARTTARVLRDDFGWDALAARSLWCFGPRDLQSPSMLLDDTLDADTDKAALAQARDLIVAGFRLAAAEGPLCAEPVRRTKFRILDAVLGAGVRASGGQIIPVARNAVHCGLLTAAPRLLEPVYRVHVSCTAKSVPAVHTILEKRRGWVLSETPVAGTPLSELEGCVPIIDSVGLDTDMRLYTQGQAFCSLDFLRWDVVPGDPMDLLCPLPQMGPVPRASMARDFVMKTRRRKGLGGEPTLQKYVDPELYASLRRRGILN